ncbi:centrosomal protein of 164 kDa isoform X1 [Schistocerca gregaria]|uniref:centrosomal protein of 164 kDa isoform X1 n=1 Tax=Schistocerca gregaria TaxID=7010 RepID=UPI00211EB233|nr:centrosomal protein of 164 kDa isoform X1 [Schistocerca gregaria]
MSCSPSARTIICNEIFDENSLPSEEEVHDYAVKIGIDPDSEPHLLHLARDGLMQALPPGWKPCYDEELQSWYYFNFKTGESRWEHPLDDVYRRLVVKGRSESISSAGQCARPAAAVDAASGEEDSKTSLKEELRSYEEGLGSEGLGSTGTKPTGITYLKKSSIQLAPLKKSPLSPVVALPGTMVATGGRVQTATPGGRAEPLRVDLRSPSDREVLPLSRNRIDIDKMGAATLLGRPSPGPIDIDKMSVAPLLGESGDGMATVTSASRRSALPPSAQEKHPRSLVQQGRGELKLSGGGSVFLKSRQQQHQQQQAATATTPTSEDTPAPATGAGGSGDESSVRRGILREQRSGSTETRDDSARSSTPLWEMNPAHMTGEQKQQWRRQELEDEQRKSVRFNLLDSADLDIRFQTSDNENDEENGSEDYEEERIENNKEETWDSEEEDERKVGKSPTPMKKVTVSIPDVRHSSAECRDEEKEDISINEDLCPIDNECKLETQVERVEHASESISGEPVVVSETRDGHEVPVRETDASGSERDGECPVTWMAEVSVVQSTVVYDQAPENNIKDNVANEDTEGPGAAVVKEEQQVEEMEEVEEEEEEEVEEEEEDENEDEEQAEYVSGKEANRSGETDSKEHSTGSKGKENALKEEQKVQSKVSSEEVDVSEPKGAMHTEETGQSEEDEAAHVIINDGAGDNDASDGAGESSAEHDRAPPVPKHKIILRHILVQSDTVTESEDMVSARETVVQEDEAVKRDAPVGEKCDTLKGEAAAKSEGISRSDGISKSDPLTRSDIGTKSEGLSKSDPLTKSSEGVSASERVIRSEEADGAAPEIPAAAQDAGGKEAGKGEPAVALSERTTQSEASEVTAHSDESSREERDEPVPGARSLPVDGKAVASPVRAVHSEEAGGNSAAGLALSRSETVETSPERDMANGTASTSDSSPLPKLVREGQGKPEDTVACTTTATTTTSSGTSIDVDVRKEANLRLKERLQEMERQAAETVRLHREKLQAQVDAAVQELEAEQEQRLSELAERLALKEEVERERIISESRCRLDAIRVNTEQQERILRAECEMRLQQLEADCRARLEASQRARAEEMARIEAEDEAQLREARARLAVKQAELQRQVDAAIAEREALLAKHRKELADLENEVRPEQLSEEHREALDKLRAEQEAALERIKAQFQHEEEAVRQEHAERLEELKVRLELERQRLWDRGLVDDNESARQQLVETSRVFEKLRCEKRLLEDKYRTLKEKYLRLKTDVKISMERRKRREAALNSGGTGSDSERIVSQRATGTSGPVFERSKSLNTEKSRSAADRQRQLATAAEDTVMANRGGNGPVQQQTQAQAQPGAGKLLTGEARDAHNMNDINKGGTNGSSNNNNINNTAGNNTNSNTNNNSTRRRRQLFSRHHSTPTARTTNNNAANNNNNIAHSIDVDIDGEINGDGGRSCSPVENLRRQLRTLEDLEDQFPAASHTDTYLRYPFSDTGKFGSSELEFFRHRIHLERDSVRRAKDFLRMQRDSFQARQNELRQRQEGRGPSARSMLDQLYKEERELTDMEVSLHRTKSLLGEKIIRLRHLEQSLQRAGEIAPDGKVDNAHPISGGPGGTTLSDLSSHSGSSGFSSTELATDTQGQVNDMTRRGAHYQESTEIIKSLENLNTEIREIWDVLNKQQKDGNIASNSLPPPPPLAYTWVPPVTVPVAVPAYHHPPPPAQLRRYGGVPDTTPTQSGLDRSLVERTRSLRDWLRQARLDGNAARGVSPGPGQTRVTTAAI